MRCSIGQRAGKRRPRLLVYDRSSPAGRERLREAGWSYMGADGRVLLQAPPLYVDRDRPADRSTQQVGWGRTANPAGSRNPFAVRGSRVARWLLLHPEQSFVISELAAHVALSVAAVSRAVQALDELALVQTATAAGDARGREVRVSRPIDLLNAWLPVWQRRRVQRTTWDIGADSIASAIKLVVSAAAEQDVGWALGGLAGAAEIAGRWSRPTRWCGSIPMTLPRSPRCSCPSDPAAAGGPCGCPPRPIHGRWAWRHGATSCLSPIRFSSGWTAQARASARSRPRLRWPR